MLDNYKDTLLKNAASLDSIITPQGEIMNLVCSIIQDENRQATISLLKKISEITKEPNQKKEVKQLARQVRDNLVEYHGVVKIRDFYEAEKSIKMDSRTLGELLDQLNALTGLETVKQKVRDLIVFQKIQKLRETNKLFSSKNTMHLAFTGNPGTGKTTVARIVGHIYKRLGLLSIGHFIEVSRTDLIAGYQGQTALKVKRVIEKAKGGVLFIDEAYSITENEHSDSYGKECLTELTKALEDYRDDLVVIVAGYTVPMQRFFESNPGLKSRFNSFIEFPDYFSDELEKILVTMCQNNDYLFENRALFEIRQYFSEITANKGENFANGRLVRNLYDDLVMNHARRVFRIENATKEDLSTIKTEDFIR